MISVLAFLFCAYNKFFIFFYISVAKSSPSDFCLVFKWFFYRKWEGICLSTKTWVRGLLKLFDLLSLLSLLLLLLSLFLPIFYSRPTVYPTCWNSTFLINCGNFDPLRVKSRLAIMRGLTNSLIFYFSFSFYFYFSRSIRGNLPS